MRGFFKKGLDMAARGPAWLLVVGGGLLALALVSLGGGGLKFLESPGFCGGCHSMKPYAALYDRSSHGSFQPEYQCMECHGEVRVGELRNKFVGVLYSHLHDGPPTVIAHLQGRAPTAEFDPDYPVIPSERCLRCHAPDATGKNAFPQTVKTHSKPIDVSSQFAWVLSNPRGGRYQCKTCHAYITHPTGGPLLPLGRKSDKRSHPFFKTSLDIVTQIHIRALDQGFIKIGGRIRKFTTGTCRRCHTGNVAAGRGRPLCQGCHSSSHTVKPPAVRYVPLSTRVPDINDSCGVKGEVGSGRGSKPALSQPSP